MSFVFVLFVGFCVEFWVDVSYGELLERLGFVEYGVYCGGRDFVYMGGF